MCDRWALGKKKKRERTQVQAKRIEPKMHHEQASKQSCFKSLTNHNKHIKKRKGCKTWKGKKLKKPLTYNDSVLQSEGGFELSAKLLTPSACKKNMQNR